MKAQLLQLQKKMHELMDSNATQEEAISVMNEIEHEVIEIKHEIDDLDQYLEEISVPSHNNNELRKIYKKTIQLIQRVKDEFDFPDPSAERRMMYTDDINNPDFDF